MGRFSDFPEQIIVEVVNDPTWAEVAGVWLVAISTFLAAYAFWRKRRCR